MPATDSGLYFTPWPAKASPSADSSTGLGLLRSREAGPRTAQRPKHQLAAGRSPQDQLCQPRPLPEREGERERADRQEGGSFRLPRFRLMDMETSDQKAADQCPKVPACPGKPSRWPSTQAGREDPASPFFWQDVFPRGDNGSIFVFPGSFKAVQPQEISEPWGIKHPLWGQSQPSASISRLQGGFALSQPTTLAGDQGGLGLASVHCWSV